MKTISLCLGLTWTVCWQLCRQHWQYSAWRKQNHTHSLCL